MNNTQLKLYKTRWLLMAVAMVAVSLIAGFEELFRSGATLGLGFRVTLTARRGLGR